MTEVWSRHVWLGSTAKARFAEQPALGQDPDQHVTKCHPLAKKPLRAEHSGNPFWKNLAKIIQILAGVHKQESCRHIRTDFKSAILTIPR